MIAVMCERFRALPFPGSVLEQPFGLLLTVKTLLGYAEDFAIFQERGNDAPARVRARVLAMAARSVGALH